MSDHLRHKAYEAGLEAAHEGDDRSTCNRQPGTIYFDDWHDGYNAGECQRSAALAKEPKA